MILNFRSFALPINYSFENSDCKDYVTEKFFKVFDYDMVPIVFGGANYSKLAPEKSFIHIDDFETTEKFIEYIDYLDKNVTAFAEYFEWKKYLKVNFFSKVFCQLCEALNDKNRNSFLLYIFAVTA